MNVKPDSYTERFAGYLGTTHIELLQDAHQVECTDCGSIYLDPWLTEASQVTLFQVASPTHVSGWTDWEIATRTGAGQPHMNRLAQLLTSRLAPINHYVEVACPFSGLLLATTPPERVVGWRASNAPSSRWDWRMTKMARINSWWSRWGLAITDLILKLRRAAYGAKTVRSSTTLPFSAVRTLAVVPSLRRWSFGCTRYGSGCTQVAMQSLDCQVKLLDELPANSADLLGIFNSIDHVDDPVAVLRRSLEIAPNVVVGGHEPSRAKYQHAYALDAETLRRLGKKYSFTVTDLVGHIDDWPRLEYLVLLNRA